MSYNGWSNYETWNYKLWMDNDYGLYQYVQENARHYIGKTYEFSKFIEDMIEEQMPDLGASMFSDLLSSAFREINLYEIAENILSDIEVEEESEEESDEVMGE